jgi:glutathione synthase/RimK-type ligase-like ATP-grasp enzyme
MTIMLSIASIVKTFVPFILACDSGMLKIVPRKNKAAVTLAKLRMVRMTGEERSDVASQGGKARAEKLTPEVRSLIAKTAAAKRWKR